MVGIPTIVPLRQLAVCLLTPSGLLKGTVAAIIDDHEGSVIAPAAQRGFAWISPQLVEALTGLQSLELAKNVGLSRCLLETDAAPLVARKEALLPFVAL
ncbi:hypothetical protein ACOSQ3_021281 [Xanthoceras sorbifolium]